MRRWALLAVAAFAGSAPERAEAEDPPAEKLRRGGTLRPREVLLRLEEGRRVHFTRVVKLRIERKVGEKESVGAGECTSDLELSVGKPTEDWISLSVRALRSRGWWDQTGEPRVEFDTAKAPVDEAGPAGRFVEVAAPGSFHVANTGFIVEVKALDFDQYRAATLAVRDKGYQQERAYQEYASLWKSRCALMDFAASWPELLPIGEGLEVIRETTSFPPCAIDPLYCVPLRHELQGVSDDRVFLKWTGGVRGASTEPGASTRSLPNVKASSFTATAEVDREDGLVRKSHAKLSLVRSETFTEGGRSVLGREKHEWEAVMERAVAGAPPGAGSGSPAPVPPPATPPGPSKPDDGSAPK